MTNLRSGIKSKRWCNLHTNWHATTSCKWQFKATAHRAVPQNMLWNCCGAALAQRIYIYIIHTHTRSHTPRSDKIALHDKCVSTSVGTKCKYAYTHIKQRCSMRNAILQMLSTQQKKDCQKQKADPQPDMAARKPAAAICVQDVDVQCVLQFTLIHAVGCALHRPTSQVIHCLEQLHMYMLAHAHDRFASVEKANFHTDINNC